MARRKATATEVYWIRKRRPDGAYALSNPPEMQPARCTGCGKAVRPGMNDPCHCFPTLTSKFPPIATIKTNDSK